MTNGYCRDTVTILGANNLDLLSPSLALQHEETLPIAKAYFAHLVSFNRLNKTQQLWIQRPFFH